MIDKIILQSLIDPKSPYKALEYLEKNMTQKEFFDWLIEYINKQKNNENKIIEIPIDIVGIVFLQYIQDNFNKPYGEIKNDLSNLIKFSPADINEEKLFEDFYKTLNKDDYWYQNILQYLLKVFAPDCKIIVNTTLFYEKGKNQLSSIFCPESIIPIVKWNFAKE